MSLIPEKFQRILLDERGNLRPHVTLLANPMLGVGGCMCGHVPDDPIHIRPEPDPLLVPPAPEQRALL